MRTAVQSESYTLLAAPGLRETGALVVSGPLAEQSLDSRAVRVALPRECSLPAKLGLVHGDLEANFLNKSPNCSRVVVLTQKLTFRGSAYVIAVDVLYSSPCLYRVAFPKVCSGAHRGGGAVLWENGSRAG